MKTYWCQNIYNGQCWLGPSQIKVNDFGIVEDIISSSQKAITDQDLGGLVIPGFQNCHSHIFQYVMAGLVEHTSSGKDDFWSWRNTMYKVANILTPDQLEVIASLFFAESLAHGYSSHVEFHYLHHDRNGKPYQQKNIMAESIAAAAQKTGMQLTIIPVYYNRGGFEQSILPEQRRFYSSNTDEYFQLITEISSLTSQYPFILGQGVHSVRAATLADCANILNSSPSTGPNHIHIAEQEKEVTEFLELYGSRPVEWLLENIHRPTNMVHATHISEEESIALAKSQHNVVLCPSTEGNLGDGIFPLAHYHKMGGKWCIGTDCHINLSPLTELNLADYCQRFLTKSRNPLLSEHGGDTGQEIFTRVQSSSLVATGVSSSITKGEYLRAIVIDNTHPILTQKPIKRALSGLIYGNNQSLIKATLVAGDIIAEKGQHKNAEIFRDQYTNIINVIIASLNQGLNS